MSKKTSSKQIVTACPNRSCKSYGIPINMSPSLRQRYKNGIPCEDCSSKIFPRESFASVKCNSCRKFKNYLHEELLVDLSTQNSTACSICGGLDTQVKFFVQGKKIQKDIIASKKITSKSKQNSKKIQENNNKSIKTKSGISLPPPLPESQLAIDTVSVQTPKAKKQKEKSQPSNPEYRNKKSVTSTGSIFDMGEPIKKQRPKTSKAKAKQGTPNRPWRDRLSSGGIVKSSDEFEVQHRKCAECGAIISMSTIQARPDTKYCIDHIEKAGRFVPVNDGIMSREGAKQMRGKDRSLAQQSKKVL